MTKIGFIGLGNMGSAIIRGLADRDDLEIIGFDPDSVKGETLNKECGLVAVASEKEVVAQADYVVLAVKPQFMKQVMDTIVSDLDGSTCLISIALGLTMKQLDEFAESRCPIVRVMPNTPALVKAGVFAVCLEDERLSDGNREMVRSMFEPLGQVHIMAEKGFDAFTGLIGSGPAYVFYIMEAFIEAGVHLGLPRPQATEMVQGLMEGSVKMAVETGIHVGELREMVTSPAGSTTQALVHMDRTAVRASLIDAVKQSYLKSVELGK